MTAQPVTPRPSAAVTLLRQEAAGISVFMVRRHGRSAFMPDVYVFPGGSIQASDAQAELVPDLCAPAGHGPTALGNGFRVAALRECFEEAGVLLARRGDAWLAVAPHEVDRFAAYRDALNQGTQDLVAIARREGLTLATDALRYWAHWITPESFPRRFDTHFFLAAMPEQQEAAHDCLETTEGLWIAPEAALAAHQRGEFPLVLATIHQLRALTDLHTLADAWARFDGVSVRTTRPVITRQDEEEVPTLPEAT